MTATDLFTSLKANGFGIRNDAGRLMVSPASKLSESQLEAIKAHRADLLKLIAETEAGFRRDCWAAYDRCEFFIADIMHHCQSAGDIAKLNEAVAALAAVMPTSRANDPGFKQYRPGE